MALLDASVLRSEQLVTLFDRVATLLEPSPRIEPDEWARQNRVYPPSAGLPGPRDPALTPYTIPFARAVASRLYKRCVLAICAQAGKSDTLMDIIGHHFDQHPAPMIYVGPSKQFLTEQWEPRIMGDLLDQAPSIRAKVARGKRMTKTRKLIAGQPLRLAHAGSSTALKSDPMSIALTDEADELMRNVKGQGDPITLIDRRGETHADFTHAIVSTPSQGPKEAVVDPKSGLEFWSVQDADDLNSKVWALWQEGTRHHWAWRCPECEEWFIPRFSCLHVEDKDGRSVSLEKPKGVSPSLAGKTAHLICPRNGCVIREGVEGATKADMNETGVYVAPGQWIDEDGVVYGDPPESSTISFWVSGLASPFVSWADRAESYVKAFLSGDQEEVRAITNGGFGELWAPSGGDVPEWEEVKRLRLPYQPGDIPEGVVFLTVGVDVQKNRLVYVIRGWGARQESWLIAADELWGPTEELDVWGDLDEVLDAQYGGLPIARMFVDAGFRPGKKDAVPEHRVYEFARRRGRAVYATKGFENRPLPLTVNRIDVKPAGGKSPYGLDLVRLSTDFFKTWVHERLRWPEDQPGGWHLHAEVTDDYCKQIVSEARVRKPKGNGFQWVVKYRNNHFLDAEALAYAAAYMLGAPRLKDDARRPSARVPAPKRARPEEEDREPQQEPRETKSAPKVRESWLKRRERW